jgi:hypothetical protein
MRKLKGPVIATLVAMLATSQDERAQERNRRIVKPSGLVNAAPQVDPEPATGSQQHSHT